MIKQTLTLGTIVIATSIMALATDCSTLTGCQKKICELEVKADALTEPHAKARVETALAETKANCTDTNLAAHDAMKTEKHDMKINHKIAEKKEDIAEAQHKKAKAMAEGKMDKVHKYERKIEEKQLDIKHLEMDK